MNAPDLGPVAGLYLIDLSRIDPSKTNPRKRFDAAAMAELTVSVAAHGVIQPILVRPTGSRFELVAGERRFRAAQAAQLSAIPALVRDLTDLEALELQVVENLKRADLHPLEEAEGYERLLDAHGMTVDQIADKLGKSKAYVYARLKLTALGATGREAFYEGKLNPSTALLIARIPGAKLQEKAIAEITEPDYRGETFSVRLAAEHIQRNYMLRLENAPFSTSDADLIKKAGACTACPKRAGNQPELFGDVSHADTCTDPTCFAAKKLAHWATARRDAEAKGIKIIDGDEAKKIAASSPYSALRGGYVRLADRCHEDSKDRTYEKILGKAAKTAPIAMLEDAKTKELVAIAKLAELKPLLKEKGVNIATPKDRSAEEPGEAKVQRPKFDPRENEVHERVLTRARQALHDQPADAITHEDLVAVALAFWWLHCDHSVLTMWYPAWASGQELRDELAKLSPGDIGRFMVDTFASSDEIDACDDLFKRRGIDVAKIEAEVRAALEAEWPAEPKPEKAAKTKGKKA